MAQHRLAAAEAELAAADSDYARREATRRITIAQTMAAAAAA
jgi:hypothetical protein